MNPSPTTPEHTTDDAPPPPSLPMTLRPMATVITLMTLGALSFVVLTAIGLALPSGGPAAHSIGEQAAFCLSGLLIWGVLALLSRPRLTITESGLTVVNLTAVRTLEWAEVVRVNLREGDSWASLDLDDGSALPVMAIQPASGREAAVRNARMLRDLVDSRSGADPR
ncbi:PH domain-containing protein [Streptomyces sp. SM14]|uniref:PH domain-containing protein n=2 Tax=unclassified Streptomyces TaxID=2593676 RepID=UPI0027E54CD6|nr:PH domain-containing protein [Streptomyces sp. SM14]